VLSPRFALYLDVHAAIRLQTGYQLLPILLVALDDRLLFAHADRFDLVARDALADEVISDRIGASLRKLLVVGLRAETIGMPGHQDDLELLHLRELADDLRVDRRLAFGLRSALSKSNSAFESSVIFWTGGVGGGDGGAGGGGAGAATGAARGASAMRAGGSGGASNVYVAVR
jgi:hypothetical protein